MQQAYGRCIARPGQPVDGGGVQALDFYRKAFGFSQHAYAGLETGAGGLERVVEAVPADLAQGREAGRHREREHRRRLRNDLRRNGAAVRQPAAIDARTDIYSIGVIGYELLTLA